MKANVVDVVDGDTVRFTLADGSGVETVRLIGIDTPETKDPNDPVECFGAEATHRTEVMLRPGRTVYLERDVTDRDRYDRLLRYVWFLGKDDGKARLANEILVQEGFAIVSTYQPDSRHADRFVEAEQQAQAEGLGLWSACGGADTPLEPTTAPVPTEPPPPPVEEPVFEEPPVAPPVDAGGECDPAYPGVCTPPAPPDLDCPEVGYTDFTVLPPDPHGFDRDRNGVGCES